MALFEDAAQVFAGKARNGAKGEEEATATSDKSPSKEVEELRTELEALQAKVDRLSR